MDGTRQNLRILAAAVLCLFAGPGTAAEPVPAPTFAAYPFISKFDGGKLGAKVGRMLNAKASRTGAFTTFAEVNFDEQMSENPYQPAWDARHRDIAAHAGEAFDARIVVWGRLERDGRGYRLRVRALDLGRSEDPKLSLVLDRAFDCKNLHALVPACQAVVDACAKRKSPGKSSGPAEDISKNLLPGGDFEKARGGRPFGWDRPAKGVTWESAGRRCIRFDVSKSAAATTGVIYYSDPIPVEPGAYYRLEMDIQTDGPQVIVWAKGYTTVGELDGKTARDEVEAYRHQKRHYPEGRKGGWEHYRTKPFRPKHPRFPIRTMRVMLYAYLKPGAVRFDNVTVKKVGAPPETASDRAMTRAFGEKNTRRDEKDRELVGGIAPGAPRKPGEGRSSDRKGGPQ